MSASLVGSEMCIRDSSPRARSARSQQAGQKATAAATGSASSAAAAPAAVSYTHLTLPTICSV
eukprot:6753945-Alexandrium_andersonii.AAC.1